jgi:hypothetical protein
MLRKTSAAAAVIAFATVGSALFGGAALAGGDHGNGNGNGNGKPAVVNNTGGPGGPGGDVFQKCNQDATAFNIFKGKAYDESAPAQTATASNACTATGGAGGVGGTGATY